MRSKTTSGILCLTAGIAVFSVQDLILKTLSGNYPLHQAMVLRSLTALPFHLAIVWVFDGRLSTIITPGWGKMLARGLLNFCAYTCYYLGLSVLPMATTIALWFTGPLFITLSSALILGEKVSRASGLAVALGFAGVLLIIQPAGSTFQLAALLPALGALGYALAMIASRPLGRTETTAAMAFWGNICFLICALALSLVFGGGDHSAPHPALAFLTRGWILPSLWDLTLMASCGVIAAVGLTLLTHAYRIAPSAAVAPFEYSFMFWGLLWGWIFWSEMPDPLAWVGIATIIGAGLYVVRQPGPPPTAAREAAS